jgi:hypothetical protein
VFPAFVFSKEDKQSLFRQFVWLEALSTCQNLQLLKYLEEIKKACIATYHKIKNVKKYPEE